MGLSSRLMDLVGRLLRLGVFSVAQRFAAIAQCDAVRLRKRCCALALQGPQPRCNPVM